MNEQEQIEEILTEASAYGQRNSVEWYARQTIDFISEVEPISAYQSAYWMFVTNEEK